MNRDGDKSSKAALRSQKQPRTHQQVSVQKRKKKDQTSKDAQSGFYSKETQSNHCDSRKEVKSAAPQGKRPGKLSPSASAECPRSPGAHRKLSDASNASEDLSKDSGCLSGKLSSSDSSSEISDCPSESNKHESQSSDNDLSWIDGAAYVSPDSEGKVHGKACAKAARGTCAIQPDAAGGGLSLFNSSGAFMTLVMGETREDLVREVEDLRSENEYLKDEVEELRCEMLEMRDMFQEEEVYQLQELRRQLEQANKTCRILQYRLRKAERRSIRVAQTGHVDGELVRSLEHDIKVAKSVSLRLCNELEVVQKKNSQLEFENEVLREKTQELEVAKQVLQAEVEKARALSLKKKRSPASKAEKRLSQQIEDDSADLKCQLHFAKEELALMCKKLTKLVSESEGMREELAKYYSTYGDIDSTHSPDGKYTSAHVREAEVKVHLKLVEEEATLLSRRIVELEVENRGLRAEMSDLREKIGGGEEEEQENQDVLGEDVSASTPAKDRVGRQQNLKLGCLSYEQGQNEEAEKGKGVGETSLLCNQSQAEVMITACPITREGPVGGEWDPSDNQEADNNTKLDRGLRGMNVKDYETLAALRDRSCLLISAIQLLNTPPKNGYCSSSSCPFTSPTEVDSNGKTQKIIVPGPLNEAVELLQTMLLAFIGRVETLLTGEDSGKKSAHKDGHIWDPHTFSFLPEDGPDQILDSHNIKKSPSKQECVEDLRTTEVKERAKRQTPSFQWDLIHSCRSQKMQLSVQILWILHQWCQVKGPDFEGKERKDKTMSMLQRLLRDLSAEIQNEQIELDSEAKAMEGTETECAVSGICNDERRDRTCSSIGKRLRQQFSLSHSKKKNWCYLSQEAALMDQEDPVKTWDHLIMPLSFPDLDFKQISMRRSHTAPEKSPFRIYYSPPSARRVQLAQLKQSPTVDRPSVKTPSPWCMPLTSFSLLSVGSANLRDDMKEKTASWRQRVHDGSQEKTGRLVGRWVDVACAGTQTHMKPQMVSVGLQTDGTQGQVTVKNSPSRGLTSSLVSTRSHHISNSLDTVTGRVERPTRSSSSPKLYRTHSVSGASCLPSSPNLSTSFPSVTPSRDRALWNLNHQSYTGLTWTRQTNPRAGAGQNHSSLSSAKPPSKPAGTNRYGLVTEFLRRVSGRAEKPEPAPGQKAKITLKNVERAPTRPPAIPLHRTDSVTRIVNQRFMKQREEAVRVQKEERGNSLHLSVRPSVGTAEDGNYDCNSSSTLTFCFARPSRSTQTQMSKQSKVQRHRYPAAASTAADSSSEREAESEQLR